MSLASDRHWSADITMDITRPLRLGAMVLGGFAATFLLWAVLFPLSSAVTVSGTIISTGQNKTVAHTNGGTVRAILRREGERVSAGEVIISLDPTVDQATLERLMSRRFSLMGQEARLTAERAQAANIIFPQELLDARTTYPTMAADIDKVMVDQRGEFEFGLRRHAAELDVLRRQIDSMKRDSEGFKARFDAKKSQVASLTQQVTSMRAAIRNGYIARNTFLEAERRLDDMKGELQGLEAQIASIAYKISETDNRIQQVMAARFEKNGNDLSRVRSDLGEITNQVRGATYVAQMTDIRSPVDGIVAKMTTHTIGGVVKPGDVICEIVPDGMSLQAEGRVAPEDIDHVKLGQKADLFVTAFNRRLSTPFPGTVAYVSADSFTDQQRGIQYYIVRVNLDAKPDSSNRIADVKPGMTSEIYITTGSHTFLAYFMKPITDSFRRAFRER